jgi:alpha-amylase/alpha-mannosidase (GH57 family)
MLNLILVIHCHQPIGNFGHVFDMAHKKCYRPLLELLESHPAVKGGLHFSGPLLEWLDKQRPESQEILRRVLSALIRVQVCFSCTPYFSNLDKSAIFNLSSNLSKREHSVSTI